MQDDLLGAPVKIGDPPFQIDSPKVHESPWLESSLLADTRRAILTLDGIATYAVRDGEGVTVAPAPGIDEGVVSAYLNSTVAALLLAQRGRFALHANALRLGERVVLVAGESGAGKSTTSVRLLQRGFQHIADDVCLLVARDDRVVVQATERAVRLMPETAQALDFDVSSGALPFPGSEKIAVPLALAEPASVDAVVVLRAPEGDDVTLRQVRGAQAVERLAENLYRAEILRIIWPEETFLWAVEVAQRVRVHELTRPVAGWTVDAVADAVQRAALT